MDINNIIFGTRQIAGSPSYKDCDENTGLEILDYAFEKGIRSFDAAPIYGNGKSEKLLGKMLQKHKDIREEFTIITKFGMRLTSDGGNYFDFSSESIQEELAESLRRLKTGYIDIYLLHIPQGNINTDAVIQTLNSLKKSGKIRAYGVCNMYRFQLQRFLKHPDSEIEYIQDFYNLIERKAETLIFPFLKDQKFLAYSPLYRGLLTDITPGELLKKDEDAINRLMKNQGLPGLIAKRKLLEKAAKEKGIGLQSLATKFLQNSSHVESILFGTTNKEHLDRFLEDF